MTCVHSDLGDNAASSDLAELFVRADLEPGAGTGLALLFELAVQCRARATGEQSELCCGWAQLPLVDASAGRQPLACRSYDLALGGGSVFGRHVPLEGAAKHAGAFGELIGRVFGEAKLKVSVREPSSALCETLNCLPEPLIASTVIAPFIKYYREAIGKIQG